MRQSPTIRCGEQHPECLCLLSIVAALVAVSFAGLVSAAEVKTDTKTETTTTSPSGEVKVEKKEVKKTVKHKKHHKHHKHHKKAAKKAVAPEGTTTTTPAEAPAAK